MESTATAAGSPARAAEAGQIEQAEEGAVQSVKPPRWERVRQLKDRGLESLRKVLEAEGVTV